MSRLIDLEEKNLKLLSERISVPKYSRYRIKTGIVHVGIGGFHRAHQAFYTNKLLKDDSQSEWGICGICLLERDRKMFDILRQQDGLYTLMHKQEGAKPQAAILGAIVEYYYAPEDPQKVIKKMADSSVKIISLTITEGGYNYDDAAGDFNWQNPNILWDKENSDKPRTIFGYLTAALRKRKIFDLPITIQSCDNIQQNGAVAKAMLFSFVKESAPDLLEWIKTNVSFPNSMVDRITPSTTKEDIALLQESYDINDHWPVVSESFHQWIIGDEFIAGRPRWEKVGVQFVSDVHPYEKMKIRILNGGHSLTGLVGILIGYQYIHEAAADPIVATFLKQYISREVTPTLDPIKGVDMGEYKCTVINRFKNPFIKDSVGRIILESSSKLPKFILPTIKDNLEKEGPVKKGITIVACWYCYLERAFDENRFEKIEDTRAKLLFEYIKTAKDLSPLRFIDMKPVFGDLSSSDRFTKIFLKLVDQIRKQGIKATLQHEL